MVFIGTKIVSEPREAKAGTANWVSSTGPPCTWARPLGPGPPRRLSRRARPASRRRSGPPAALGLDLHPDPAPPCPNRAMSRRSSHRHPLLAVSRPPHLEDPLPRSKSPPAARPNAYGSNPYWHPPPRSSHGRAVPLRGCSGDPLRLMMSSRLGRGSRRRDGRWRTGPLLATVRQGATLPAVGMGTAPP